MSTIRNALPASVRQAVTSRASGRCEACGCDERLTFNHIQPLAFGGEDTAENVELVCSPCHKRRHREAAVKWGGGRHPQSHPREKKQYRELTVYHTEQGMELLRGLAAKWDTTQADVIRRLIREAARKEGLL